MVINREIIAQRLGAFGLFSFMFFAWVGTAGAYLGLLLICIAFVAVIPLNFEVLKRDKVAVFFVGFCLYLLFRTAWSVIEYPELMGDQIKGALQWASLGLFIPIAWWIRQSKYKTYIVLAVLMLGFALSVIKLTDWDGCNVLVGGRRCGFGFQLILGALLLGTALLGLMMFIPRIVGRRYLHWTWFLRLLLWGITTSLLAYFLLLTQTRAVWLGICVVLPLALVWRYWEPLKAMVKGEKKVELVIVLLALVALVGAVVSTKSMIQTRVDQSIEESLNIISSWGESDVDGPIGLRVSMYKEGYRMWMERPWFGWGPSGANYPMFLDGINEETGYLTHFHSTYLEALVRFGIVGCSIFLIVIGLLLINLHARYRRGGVSLDLYCFFTASMALLLLWSISDYQVASTDWRILFIALLGLAYSPVIGRSNDDQIN